MDDTQAEALADLGSYLRTQREMAQLSLRHLARLTKVSDSYLSQLERGLYQPSPEVLVAIARGLGLSPGQIFRRLGWLPTEDESAIPSVMEAIAVDGKLSAAQKAALAETYRAMVGGD